MQKENTAPTENHQYVGPYRLDKTLGKGQTGKMIKYILITKQNFYGIHFIIIQF